MRKLGIMMIGLAAVGALPGIANGLLSCEQVSQEMSRTDFTDHLEAAASCPGGTELTGGGCDLAQAPGPLNAQLKFLRMVPNGDSFECLTNDIAELDTVTLTSRAVCCTSTDALGAPATSWRMVVFSTLVLSALGFWSLHRRARTPA